MAWAAPKTKLVAGPLRPAVPPHTLPRGRPGVQRFGKLPPHGAPGVVPTTAAPRPPAPAGQAGVPLPPDPAYQAQMAALARQRDTQIAGLGQQRRTGLLQYGYVQDPTTGAITFDASNPLSQAALMKLNFDRAATGTTNSMAARGQLYAGSTQNAQNEVARQRSVAQDQQIKALQAFLAKVDAAKAQAQTDYELGAGDALGGSVQRAADNPLYTPVVDEGGGGAAQVADAVKAAAATARTATAPHTAAAKRAIVRKVASRRPVVTGANPLKKGAASHRPITDAPKRKPKPRKGH